MSIEDRVSQHLFVLRVMERVLHDNATWSIKLDHPYLAYTVMGNHLGLRTECPRFEKPAWVTPALMCNGEEIMYQPEVQLPAYTIGFTWWFTAVSDLVA